MNGYPDSIKNLIDQLARLPGFGPKTAERVVFYLLKQNNAVTTDLIASLQNLKKNISLCRRCFNVTINNPCQICSDVKRDQSTVCIVAYPQDVLVIEKTGDYHGLYHVLGGIINSVEDIKPEQLKIAELLTRINNQTPKIAEVIIATNPDLEGESTAMYLARQLKTLPIKVTRIAKGLPIGSDLEYADEVTVSSALKGRQIM
jgi:recombination protein RecR